MLHHTTAKGLQDEMVRRTRQPQGIRADQELTTVSVDFRRVAAAVAVAIAMLVIIAVSALGPADASSDEAPAPGVEEQQGGALGAPLHAN